MALGYVRAARPDDAAEIARIQLTTWRYAYRRLLPARILDQLDQEWIAQRWLTAITEPPSGRHRVLVAVEQAEESYLAGFVASGDADEAVLAPGEALDRFGPTGLANDVSAITDLLVEPRWGRRGHGSRLLAASADLWREDGYAAALAWAFEGDPATRTFLTSAGWEPDGVTRALDVDDLLVPQMRFHAALR
jgi:GNAT superfamily N-acetyltransferase